MVVKNVLVFISRNEIRPRIFNSISRYKEIEGIKESSEDLFLNTENLKIVKRKGVGFCKEKDIIFLKVNNLGPTKASEFMVSQELDILDKEKNIFSLVTDKLTVLILAELGVRFIFLIL